MLPWSCCFCLNNITHGVIDPFSGFLVLLSLRLDSKHIGTAFSSPFTVAILQGIREDIFTSITLLNKVFCSSHPNLSYLPDKRQKSLMVTYISCSIVWEKAARRGVSRNFWLQAETRKLSIRSFLRF